MNNPFQIFTHPAFGDVRASLKGGELAIVGTDVARALGYARPDRALARYVDAKDKSFALVPIFRRTSESVEAKGLVPHRRMVIINESGLYALVLSANTPEAKEFKHWVTSEVLPALRKDGSYSLFAEAELAEPVAKQFSIHARNAEARDFKEFKKKLQEAEPDKSLAYELLDVADRFTNPDFKDKVLCHVVNLLAGKNLF